MLGIVPGWGGLKRLPLLIGAPGALDLMLTGKTVDARRARKLGIVDEAVPVRIMENTARGVLRALPPPHKLPLPLVVDAQSARAAASSPRRPRSRSRSARAASTTRRPTRSSSCSSASTATRSRRRAATREPRHARALADDREPDPRVQAAGAAEGARQGRRTRRSRACTSSAPARWAATSPRGARCAG
jgi:enoyl-CoA hydratase/carnithine racemase